MFNSRKGPKAEYREKQRLQVSESASLAVQYPWLKSLTATLEHRDAFPQANPTQLKYMVNLTNAKSLFLFRCPNHECIGGDFDLTGAVSASVAKRRPSVTGDMGCKGHTTQHVRCANTLHYTLQFEY